MATAKPRVKLPKTATKGEVIEIKTLISHPMESGQRKDKAGKPTHANQDVFGIFATIGHQEIVLAARLAGEFFKRFF